MSSTSSAVTHTSVHTDSEPDKVFWGAVDEEIYEGGILWVIILGYDELPIQPAHDPDYVPEPIYPEYIPLEDEHEFPVEEQPLPPVDSPTVESPGYVTESDPKEDPEEYEDDETEDGPVDYPINGGGDRDDDDGDSSGDEADDEDEDDEDEEEEHLAPTDSAVVVPAVELASISLSPEAEVERLLAMTTPSPSPPISLSPPSTRERLARIASTPALIDAVIAALPSPPLPPLPLSLYIPPPVDHMDDILESEQPPRKRLCLSTLGSRYEIEESSTARSIGDRGVDYGFVSTVDVEARWQGISEVRYGLSQATHQELQTHRDHVYAHETHLQAHQTQLQLQGTLIQTQHQTELLALRGQRRARQPALDTRIPDHQDASRDADSHVKFATCTLLGTALTWWNGQIRTLGPEAYAMTWEVLKKKMSDKYCPQGEIKKLEIELWNLKKVDKYISGLPDNIYGNIKSTRPKTLDETIDLANDLMDQKLRTYAER
ncbi:putative reverse transcriptase domain-containing protein [Tanacetum coccineum]